MPAWSKTCILRSNVGMIRDVFIEHDSSKTGDFILGIRQVMFNADGGLENSKLIRLTDAEASAMVEFWCSRHKESPNAPK